MLYERGIMIHEPNQIEWQIGNIVIADCDRKDHKMLMVVVGIITENHIRMLKTKYLNPLEMIPNCIKRLPIKRQKQHLLEYNNIWINEIKYLHDPAKFGIVITNEDKQKAKGK